MLQDMRIGEHQRMETEHTYCSHHKFDTVEILDLTACAGSTADTIDGDIYVASE